MGEISRFRRYCKNYPDTLIVEDSVLGGKYLNEFDNNPDIVFHSCGLDKRPASIFGGYVHINNDIKIQFNY